MSREEGTGKPLIRGEGHQRALIKEAAGLVRRLIQAVNDGELDASSSQGRRLLRRLEGAAAAFEETAQRIPDEPET